MRTEAGKGIGLMGAVAPFRLCVMATILAGVALRAQTGTDWTLDWHAGGGGVLGSTDGQFHLAGTAVPGAASLGAGHALSVGFWQFPVAFPTCFKLILSSGWSALSLPGEPANPAVEDVFAERGARGRGAGREVVYEGDVLMWDPAQQAYVAQNSLHANEGCWVYATRPGNAIVFDLSPVTTRLSLTPGWHLLGPSAHMPPPQNADLAGPPWEWRNGDLHPAAALIPGRSYWFYATNPTTLDLDR